MLSDIITDVIGSQPDMEMVGDLASRSGLQAAVGATLADVVLLGLIDADLPSDCLPVFTAYPSLRMLGVAADGRRGFVWQLRPERTPLGELDAEALLAAIRGAGANRVANL